MTWLQLRLDARPDTVEALEDLMLASGAVAVTMEDNADDPVLEPGVGETPLWQHIRVTALYPADTDMDAVLGHFPARQLEQCAQRIEILEDKDWEREWMSHYQPMQFGEHFWVCPSWIDPPDPTATNLLLDPGLAFGTGTHPTTALCLKAMAGLSLAGTCVVDYGCGSGILAVAALKLGAQRVLGVDNDPQALVASEDNAQRNNVSHLSVALPGAYAAADWERQADLVVANILAGPLLELSNTLLALLRPEGMLMVSGLLATQAETLMAHYAQQIRLEVIGETDGWVCLMGKLQPG
jgi:ribosomal protein L11 methyltransferase